MDFFYNENLLSTFEKKILEEDNTNHLLPKLTHKNSKKLESIDNYTYSLNETKTDFFSPQYWHDFQNSISDDLMKNIFSLKKREKKDNEKSPNNKTKNKDKNLLLSNNESNFNKKNKKNGNNVNDTVKDFNGNFSLYFNNTNNEIIETLCYINGNNIIIDGKVGNSGKNDKNPKKENNKRGPYKKAKLFLKDINIDDKCFPFKTGKGIINITTKFNNDYLGENIEKVQEENKNDKKVDEGYQISEDIPFLNYNSNEQKISTNSNSATISKNDLYMMKFYTKKYYYSETGRRRKIQTKRKYKSDIIRKKIKSRFHRTLKITINQKLKIAGSKMLFDCLAQCFVGNISAQYNTKYMNYTYRELILTDFNSDIDKYCHVPNEQKKYIKNKEVLEYLESNPEISKISGFDIIKSLKYKELLNKYFLSSEFEDSLELLKTENEPPDYIQSYIYQAKNYIEYYETYTFNKKK